MRSYRAGLPLAPLKASEVEFLAGEELVDIMPTASLRTLHLIGVCLLIIADL